VDHTYWVYIVGSDSGTLYIGVTNNLERRIWEHKNGKFEGFASHYHYDRLLCCEKCKFFQAFSIDSPGRAIVRPHPR
jgi:putative endonuclease